MVLKESVLKVQPKKEPMAQEEFLEQRRRKWNSTNDKSIRSKQKFMRTSAEVIDPQPEVPMRNFFAPLTHQMEVVNYYDEQTSTVSSALWNYSKCGVYTVESEAGC
jgi:hypothetical protein